MACGGAPALQQARFNWRRGSVNGGYTLGYLRSGHEEHEESKTTKEDRRAAGVVRDDSPCSGRRNRLEWRRSGNSTDAGPRIGLSSFWIA